MVLSVLEAAFRSVARAAPRWGWGALLPTLAFVGVYGLALMWDGGALFQVRARPGEGAQIPWRAGLGVAIATLVEAVVAAGWMTVWMHELHPDGGRKTRSILQGAVAILHWWLVAALGFLVPLVAPVALVFALPFADLAGWIVAVSLGTALLVAATLAAYTVPWMLDHALVPPQVILAGSSWNEALVRSQAWVRPRRGAVFALHLAVLALAILASDLISGWLPSGSLEQTGRVDASIQVLIRQELLVSFFSHLGWHVGLWVAGAVWVELLRRQLDTANRNDASN